MQERSKRIKLRDEDKLNSINDETKQLLKKYVVDMTLRGLSPKTIQHYKYDLEQWFIYIYDEQNNQSVLTLTDDDITEFLFFCKTEGNNVERMKLRMATISAFYNYLRKKRIIKENPVDFIDRPKHGMPVIKQTFLTKEQLDLLRVKLAEHGDIQLQTYIMFSLSTMARVNAVANIRWEQVNLVDRIVTNVLEKEGKIVDLFFSEEVRDLLMALFLTRRKEGKNDFGWVFFTGRCLPNKPISTGTLNDWCKLAGKLIGVDTLHPHDLRHSMATLYKNAGMPLEVVSSLLHHESTDTTQKFYIKEDAKRISSLKDQFII